MPIVEQQIDRSNIEELTLHWREWIIPLFIGVIILFSFLLFLLPQATSLIGDFKDIKKDEESLDKMVEKRQLLERLAENANLQDELEMVETVLPSNKPVISALFSLDQQAQQMGMRLVSYDLSPGEISTGSAEKASRSSREGLQSLPMEVTIAGRAASMSAFIKSIDTLAPLMQLKGAGLDQLDDLPEGETEDGREQEINLELEVYFAEPPSQLGSIRSDMKTVDAELQALLDKLREFSWFEPEEMEMNISGEEREDLFSF